MNNPALTLVDLSRIALVAGLDQGFNRVDVQLIDNCLMFFFGNCYESAKPAGDYARSYDETVVCAPREPMSVTLPSEARFDASYDIQRRLTEKLFVLKS